MNMPTQDSRHATAGIVSALERLTSVWRVRTTKQDLPPAIHAGTLDTSSCLNDPAPLDMPSLFPRKPETSGQEAIHRKQPDARAHRQPAAPRSDRMRQLKTALAGYIRRSGRRATGARLHPATVGLKPLLDMVPAAVIVVDEAYRVVLANELAATLFGYTVPELDGILFLQLFPYVAPDAQGRPGPFASCTEGKNVADPVERRIVMARRKDGSECEVSVKCTQHGRAGEFLWIVASVDFIQPDEAYRDTPQNARPASVFELAEMAAVLAHEINQPLTAILSNAQAVQRFLGLTGGTSTDLREAFADIVADSFRATEIVRKLRQFVRRAPPEALLLNPGNLVREATRHMRRDALARDISMTLDICSDLPIVRGDNLQLQQVMINLVQNAFDAVEECRAEDRAVSVKVENAPQGSGISIAVSDRGPGLKAAQIGEVFTPFSTSKPRGLGLGLSISISIVAAHGGHLWAERNSDRGATFRILLPSASEAESSSLRQPS